MKRFHSIDLGKFFAMLGIVFIHARAFEAVQVGEVDGSQLDTVLKVFARFSVPLFFMASGFLFSMKTNSGKRPYHYFLSYIKKIVLLYISWFLIYALYDYGKIVWQSGGLINQQTHEYISSLLTSEVFVYGVSHTQYHLWFLPALIWATAIVFCFQRLQAAGVLLTASFFLHLLGLTGQGYSQLYEIHFNTRDPFFFGLYYVSLGSFIGMNYQKSEELASRISGPIYAVVIPALFFMQLVERNWTMEQLDGSNEEYFFFTIPLSLTIFAALLKYRNLGKGTFYNKIGKNTIGIFVIHPLVISLSHLALKALGLQWWKQHLLYGILFVPFVYFSSYFLYQWLQSGKTIHWEEKQSLKKS
ncbi:acyltransferase [Sediminibacillus halophilus]|uniref:Surface polysaccharide O-acyltransferase, integral membrane enzyme n=1 Tax=Sediminibacillus halophilus TaxID=482461 RepID=A0A1G9RWF1_9BACI|nr:acyltransferase [Sediminibacillus halophilus]SDM27502.1 Surface polysaccharide O-acyltransferase, integral membrane enzyme [Sediminibacillus halophilus]